jgi:glutaredoxin
MLTFAFILLGLGCLVAFVGAILMLIAAFRESLAWGLGSLLVPFVSLIFAIAHWAEAKRGFLLQLLGACLMGGGVFAAFGSNQAGQLKAQFAQAAGEHFTFAQAAPAGTTEQQRAAKEEEIRAVEQQLAGLSAKVNADYVALSARRAKLGSDQAAITAFNQQAADYQAAKSQLETMNARLVALRAEEAALSDKVLAEARAAAQAGQKAGATGPTKSGFSLKGPLAHASGVARQAGAGDVIMFTTQRCPACVAAKDYMKKNGIAYREIDVERDPEGMKEFQRRGGRGVPLIVVKDQQMEGFNPRTLEAML